MNRFCFSILFLLPLLGCRESAPEEAMKTVITVAPSDRFCTYHSRGCLWGGTRLRAQQDKESKSFTIVDSLSSPDVFGVYKDWNMYPVYMEPGDSLALGSAKDSSLFSGHESAVARNTLYSQISELQSAYNKFHRSYQRSQEKGTPFKGKVLHLNEVMGQCQQLIDEFIKAGKGVTPAFERFLKLDQKYFEIQHSIKFPGYACKTYHPFTPEELRLMEETIQDAKYDEACLSFSYRYVVRAYLDYLRIHDPQHKCIYGQDYVKNALALSQYYPGQAVSAMVQAFCLSDLAFTSSSEPSFLEAYQQSAPEYKEYLHSLMAIGNDKKDQMNGGPVDYPDFTGVDATGKQVSLKDFRGKWVLIDVWATWCGVCQGEFKYTNTMESYFEGKDVVFLGISVDKEADHDKWIRNITDKELKGVQINIADKKAKDDFCKQLGVTGYPHYSLISPTGKQVISKLPKPSTGVQHLILNGYLNE